MDKRCGTCRFLGRSPFVDPGAPLHPKGVYECTFEVESEPSCWVRVEKEGVYIDSGKSCPCWKPKQAPVQLLCDPAYHP